eukprot:UN2248
MRCSWYAMQQRIALHTLEHMGTCNTGPESTRAPGEKQLADTTLWLTQAIHSRHTLTAASAADSCNVSSTAVHHH